MGRHERRRNGMGRLVMKVGLGGGNATTLVSGLASIPDNLALDSANVYWGDWRLGTVQKCAIAGCGQPDDDGFGTGGPTVVAVDGTNIYWLDDFGGTVMAMPLSGSPLVTLASGQSGAVLIALDTVSYTGRSPSPPTRLCGSPSSRPSSRCR